VLRTTRSVVRGRRALGELLLVLEQLADDREGGLRALGVGGAPEELFRRVDVPSLYEAPLFAAFQGS
jgi:hypothetical protein